MTLADFLIAKLPRVVPGTYERVAAALFEPIYRELVVRATQDQVPPATILDYGTGPGTVALRLAQALPGSAIHATDVSDNMLIRAEDRAREQGLRQQIRFGLLEDGAFPWPRERFDLIVAAFVLHCERRDPSGMLDALHDRLRPGGRCQVVELIGDFAATDREVVDALLHDRVVPRWFPRRTLARILHTVRAPLLPRARLEEIVRDSRFGVASRVDWLPLRLGSRSVAGAFAWFELQAPDVVTIPLETESSS